MRYIQEDEPASDGAAPTVSELLKLRQTWAVMLCRLFISPVIQFYLFWLPLYLSETRGYSMAAIGLLSVLPPLFGVAGSVGGGWVAGRLIKRGLSVEAARKTVMFAGAALCALSIAVVKGRSPFIWWGAICLVYLGHYALSANMFAAVSDFFPNKTAARVTGLSRIAGGFSGWLFPLLTGWLVDKFSFLPVFFIAALLPFLGVIALFVPGGRLTPVILGEQAGVKTVGQHPPRPS